MKVFNVMNSPAQPERSHNRKRGRKTQDSPRPPRENLSREEILEKVRTNKLKQSQKVSKVDTKFQKHAQKMDFPEDAEREAIGDIGLNNPNDPATIGKLKTLLERGGINFSEKEKNALARIVEERG
jgi:hypothetical protein